MIELEDEARSRRVLETLGVEAGYLISGMIPLINLGWLGGDRDSMAFGPTRQPYAYRWWHIICMIALSAC